MSIKKTRSNVESNCTLTVVGRALLPPGQLHVGCSRVGFPNSPDVNVPSGKTKAIIYHEAFS